MPRKTTADLIMWLGGLSDPGENTPLVSRHKEALYNSSPPWQRVCPMNCGPSSLPFASICGDFHDGLLQRL